MGFNINTHKLSNFFEYFLSSADILSAELWTGVLFPDTARLHRV